VARVETYDGISHGNGNGNGNGSARKRKLTVANTSPELIARDGVAADGIRRVTIRRLRLWSVAKVAVVFWVCVGILTVGAMFMTWLLLTSAGVIGNFEQFVTDMTGVEDFRVLSGTVLAALVLLVCVGVVVATAITVIAAEFYNIVAATLGGVEVVAYEQSVQPVSSNGQHVDGVASNGHASGDVVLKS
jgi:hypothetical protein